MQHGKHSIVGGQWVNTRRVEREERWRKKNEPTFPAAASVAMRLALRRATLCMERRNGWGIKRGLQMLRVWEDGKSSCCQRRQLSRFPKFDRSFNRLRMRPDQLGRARFLFYLFPQRAISVCSAEIAFLLKTKRNMAAMVGPGWTWTRRT